MPKNFHLGFEIPTECQAPFVGANGDAAHQGSLTLIEISEGFSKGRRTVACENHLRIYLSPHTMYHRHTWQPQIFPSSWVIVAPIEDVIVSPPDKGLLPCP